MGDGTKENPFTREDVLRLIEENGGKADGLDLSEKVFEGGIDLSGLNLKGIILDGASFPPKTDIDNSEPIVEQNGKILRKVKDIVGSNLQEVDLSDA